MKCDPALPLLSIYPRVIKTYIYTNVSQHLYP